MIISEEEKEYIDYAFVSWANTNNIPEQIREKCYWAWLSAFKLGMSHAYSKIELDTQKANDDKTGV